MANNSFFTRSIHESTRFRVNTQHFSPHDLALFVDCLETLTRLRREKKQRKELKKLAKLNNLSQHICTASTTNPKAAKTAERPLMFEKPKTPDGEKSDTLTRLTCEKQQRKELKKLTKLNNLSQHICSASTINAKAAQTDEKLKSPDGETSESDENYFSASSSGRTSPQPNIMFPRKLCKHITKSTHSILTMSDSDESGVYANASVIRSTTGSPQSGKLSQDRSLIRKSRLLSMLKKQKNENSQPSKVQLLSCRPLDEKQILKMHQHQCMQDQQTKAQQTFKLSRFITMHMKKKTRQGLAYSNGSSGERFLNKALSYLTL